MNFPGTLIRTGAALLLAAFASGAAWAADDSEQSTQPQASIPFVEHGAIENWVTDSNRGLWIQDSRRDWYYAKLLGPCIGLRHATTLGFDTRPVGTFNRFSTIIVPRGGRCAVQSVVESDGPPSKQKVAEAGSEKKLG